MENSVYYMIDPLYCVCVCVCVHVHVHVHVLYILQYGGTCTVATCGPRIPVVASVINRATRYYLAEYVEI